MYISPHAEFSKIIIIVLIIMCQNQIGVKGTPQQIFLLITYGLRLEYGHVSNSLFIKVGAPVRTD